MKCDIVIVIGGDQKQKVIITSKDDIKSSSDSSVIKVAEDTEVQTITDVINLLRTKLNPEELGRFYDALLVSKANYIVGNDLIKKRGNTINKVTLLDNCSIDTLKLKYPGLLDKLPNKEYHISFISGGYVNGKKLQGRVFANGIENFILTSEKDVRQFAITEYKKELVNRQVNQNEILPEDDRGTMLKDRYEEKLKKIVDLIKTKKEIVERIKSELNSDVNIQSVVLDYLNHKSEYLSYYFDFGKERFQAGVTLRDFTSELNLEKVIYQDSESPLAAALRGVSIKRNNFSKEDLYNVLSQYDTNFTTDYSKKQFLSLGIEGMTNLLKTYFNEDPILQNFEIESISTTPNTETKVGLNTIKSIYKKKIAEYNNVVNGTRIDTSYEDTVKEIDDAKKYIGQSITIDGETYDLLITKKDGKLVYSYFSPEFSDSDRIRIKYKGTVLSEQFNFDDYGYDTWNVFQQSNDDTEDPVTDSNYHGWHIYDTTNSSGQTTYIISRSVIYPDLYVGGQFSSLRDAKNAVIGYNHAGKPVKSTMLDLKKINLDEDNGEIYIPSYVKLAFPTNVGQVIESIDYYFPKDIEDKLPPQEKELYYNGNLRKVIEFYVTNFNLDKKELTEILDTPEKAGIFLLDMCQHGLTLAGTSGSLTENQKSESNTILNKIKNAPIKQYLVRRSRKDSESYQNGNKSKYDTYTTFIQALSDAGITVNSKGYTADNKTASQSLTASLTNMKNAFNNGIFKDTGISVEIVDNNMLENDQEFKVNGKSIFGKDVPVNTIKGFVYNNKIYINQSTIKDAANSMYHELMHITLGAIRVNDAKNNTNNYETILDYFNNNSRYDSIRDYVNKTYPNLAYQDKLEEVVVRAFARNMENTNALYLSEKSGYLEENLINQIRKEFSQYSNTARQALTMPIANDAEFPTAFNELFKGNNLKEEMKKNRVASNLIEDAIKNETIKEECE